MPMYMKNKVYESEGGGKGCFKYNIEMLRGTIATALDSANGNLANAVSTILALPDLLEIAGIKNNAERIQEIAKTITSNKSNILGLISEIYDIERENEKIINDIAEEYGIDTKNLSDRAILEELAKTLGIKEIRRKN